MEYCMEVRAFKSSVSGELAMQKTQQVVFDDFLVMNVMNGALPSEDFSVDCFLDFNNGDFEEEEEEEEKDSVSISHQERVADDDCNSNSSRFSFDSVLTNELSLPDEEIAGLEWVSYFVDDSLSELPLSCPVFKQQSENHAKTRLEAEPGPVFVKTSCFSARVPSKARSKRARPNGRAWSAGSMPLSESSSSSASSSSTCSGFSMSSTTNVPNMELDNVTEPPTKKQKKKPVAIQASGLPPFQRRCSHCQVQKTPQWRTGPLGAKTLCNACGVRYKSGRLFPEYRPACSPTFSSDMHSNSHRKVLEMRKKKELAGKVGWFRVSEV